MDVASSFLRAVGEFLESFFPSRDIPFSEPGMVAFTVFLTVLASFSSSPKKLVAILLVALLLIGASGKGKGLISVGVILAFSLAISLPRLVLEGASREVILFILRTVSSGAVLIGGVALLGVYGFCRGLSLFLPKEASESLALFARSAYALSRESVAVLFARLSRMVSDDRRSTWSALASTVEAVMNKATRKAFIQKMAIEARTVGWAPKVKFRPLDAVLAGVAACIALML